MSDDTTHPYPEREEPMPDINPSRLAEDVAYRLACREMVKLLQAEHVAELERRLQRRIA